MRSNATYHTSLHRVCDALAGCVSWVIEAQAQASVKFKAPQAFRSELRTWGRLRGRCGCTVRDCTIDSLEMTSLESSLAEIQSIGADLADGPRKSTTRLVFGCPTTTSPPCLTNTTTTQRWRPDRRCTRAVPSRRSSRRTPIAASARMSTFWSALVPRSPQDAFGQRRRADGVCS